MPKQITLEALHNKLRNDTVIDKCRMYSHWTLPYLMAEYTEITGQHRAAIERDYQEIGSLLTNHLASKLCRILFPANASFFRVALKPEVYQSLLAKQVTDEDIQAELARQEMRASKRIFLNGSYAQLMSALKHLIVTGNTLVLREDNKCVVYGLQNYVTRRDGRGNLIDGILREPTYAEALPVEIRDELRRANPSKYSRDEQEVTIYTRVHRVIRDKRVIYEVTQAVDNIDIGTKSTYPEAQCPYLFITWSLVAGEHYGRGLVEDYAGGFAKVSDMSEAAALYGIEMMRVLHLVASGGGADIDDIEGAETGAYVRGDPNTVSAYEAGDADKVQQINVNIAEVFQRLAKAFMYEANVRDAERVTAYEIQRDTLEIAHAFGGVYSSLAQVLQVPLAHLLLLETNPGASSMFATDLMELEISAGIEALGRSTDVQNLGEAAQELAAIVPVFSQLDNRADVAKIVDIVLRGRSIDPSTIFKDKKRLAAEAEADQQAAKGQEQITNATMGANNLQQVQALDTIQGAQ